MKVKVNELDVFKVSFKKKKIGTKFRFYFKMTKDLSFVIFYCRKLKSINGFYTSINLFIDMTFLEATSIFFS